MSIPAPSCAPGFPPHANWNHVRPAEVQEALRGCFTAWGLPGRLRVDNGHPWGSWSDLPPALALWLLGLGVEVIWNRPRHPQENGTVERDQGVTQQWVEPAHCRDPQDLARRLEWAARIQRESYPAVQGRSRLAAYPALRTPVRPYERSCEDALWDVGPVERYWAGGLWRRLVCSTGQISLYDHRYSVGRPYAGQEVSVRYDAATRQWVVLDHRGVEVRRHPATQITRERIVSLTVARLKPGPPGRTTTRTHAEAKG
jgi:hypothetical protein